jgi:hypothetical protein
VLLLGHGAAAASAARASRRAERAPRKADAISQAGQAAPRVCEFDSAHQGLMTTLSRLFSTWFTVVYNSTCGHGRPPRMPRPSCVTDALKGRRAMRTCECCVLISPRAKPRPAAAKLSMRSVRRCKTPPGGLPGKRFAPREVASRRCPPLQDPAGRASRGAFASRGAASREVPAGQADTGVQVFRLGTSRSANYCPPFPLDAIGHQLQLALQDPAGGLPG